MAQTSSNQINVLNYPANIGNQAAAGEHYMMIDSYESLNAINTGATKKSSIALYIPPNAMKTGFSANYNGMEGGALKAASVSGAKRLAGAENFSVLAKECIRSKNSTIYFSRFTKWNAS